IKERSNEVIFNVSENAERVTGKVAGKNVEFTEVDSLEEYEEAEGNVYFYNEEPLNIVSQYATEGSEYDTNPIRRRPQIHVKSTEEVDIFKYDFEVTVEGFKNEGDFFKDELLEDLEVPTGLEATEVTDSMITLSWDEVDEADYYDVEADGVVYTNVKANEYEHEGLKYSTEYEYRVRTVTPEGYSNWSDTLTVMTDED